MTKEMKVTDLILIALLLIAVISMFASYVSICRIENNGDSQEYFVLRDIEAQAIKVKGALKPHQVKTVILRPFKEYLLDHNEGDSYVSEKADANIIGFRQPLFYSRVELK